jgi:hypothetical protein
MITSTFGVVSAVEGSPNVGDVYAFMGGAILGFIAVLALASGGFRHAEMEDEQTKVLVVAAALSLGSTAAGLGTATLLSYALGGLLAWGLAPFGACAVFLFVLGLEFRAAEQLED